jgi:phosphatidylserine synthase
VLLIAIIPALLLSAWGLLAAALNRAPDRAQLIGTMLATLGVLVYLVVLVATTDGESSATFIGYTATAALLPAASWSLARLEPTRYGSLIVGIGAIIMPVLALRMWQVWVVS